MLQRNVGDVERLLRVILGIYAMLLGFLFITGLVGNLLGFVGLMLVATGAVGWCGVYALMGRGLPLPVASEVVESPPAGDMSEQEILSSATETDAALSSVDFEAENQGEDVDSSDPEDDLAATAEDVVDSAGR